VERSDQAGATMGSRTPREQLAASQLWPLLAAAAGATAGGQGWLPIGACEAAGIALSANPKVWREAQRAGGMSEATFVAEYSVYVFPDSLLAAVKRCSGPSRADNAASSTPCDGNEYCLSPAEMGAFGLDTALMATKSEQFRRFGKISLSGSLAFTNMMALVEVTVDKIRRGVKSACR